MAKRITIKQVMEATGMARTTVYRRLDKGATREELIDAVTDSPDDFERSPVENNIDPNDKVVTTWCESVLWNIENMHEPSMTLEKAGSKLRYSMWKSAKKYPKEFQIQLVPKALKFMDDNKDDGSTAEANTAEHKSVQELRELLAGAIEESKFVTP